MHQPAAAIGLQYWLKKMGYPRLIITGFLLFLFIMAPITGSDLSTQTELRYPPGSPGGAFGRHAGH